MIDNNNPLNREGKVLPLLVFLLPCLFAMIGLVVDGSSVLCTQNKLQNSLDMAALTTAYALSTGTSTGAAETQGRECIHRNGFDKADVEFEFSKSLVGGGQTDSITMQALYAKPVSIMSMFQGGSKTVFASSTAGFRPEKQKAAIIVLDPNPPTLNYANVSNLINSTALTPLISNTVNGLGISQLLSPLGILTGSLSNALGSDIVGNVNSLLVGTLDQTLQRTHLAMPTSLIAGMEIEGLGRLTVGGAVQVNTQWGGVDQNADPVGTSTLPPHALSCMPLLGTTRLIAPSIRVVGGVESPRNYLPITSTAKSPLAAGTLPVSDPLINTSFGSPSPNSQGHKVVVALPLSLLDDIIQNRLNVLPSPVRSLAASLLSPVLNLLASSTLNPGRYDSLTILSLGGDVTLRPGIYELSGVNPITQISLTIVGPVQAQGVSYVLDLSDANEILGSTVIGDLLPSCAMLPLLPGGCMTPAQGANDILIYQAPDDRRPMIIESLGLLSGNNVRGTIYSKNGHLTLLLNGGDHDLSIAVGTLRIVTVLDSRIAPTKLFPAAINVSLLQ